jgi:predicted nucleic acid-binding protein
VIFIDANVPLYLVGAPHPNKDVARRLLDRCIERGERLVTDTEVLQEIMHRYVAIKRRDAIQPVFNALLGIADEVFPVELEDVEGARDVLLGESGLSSRDALHVAIMKRRGVKRILTFDAAFDRAPGIERIV